MPGGTPLLLALKLLSLGLRSVQAVGSRGDVVNFSVNGVSYFLGFNEELGKWQVLTATRNGLRRMNVVDDEALPYFGMEIWEEDDGPSSGRVQ